jgi:hypothetical protein
MNNIGVQTFLEDEVKAREAEEEVLSLIQKKYKNARKAEGNFKFYDIEVPDITTVEVKNDKRSEDTGNLYIEVSFNGQPSGIEASTAEWWVFVDSAHYYFIKRDSLDYLLRENRCFTRKIKGEDGTTEEYKLIKKDLIFFSPYCKVIKRG